MAKGLGILCITLLHYEEGLIPRNINVFIGTFMITVFYVSAGWVSAMSGKQLTFKQLLTKRWHQLGIPYCWWTVIILAFDLIMYLAGYYDFFIIERDVYKTITLRGIGTLWFIPALFGGEVLWHFANRRKIVFIPLLLAAGCIYSYYYHYVFSGRTDLTCRIINAPFMAINNINGGFIGVAFGHLAYFVLGRRTHSMAAWRVGLLGIGTLAFAYACTIHLPSYLSFFHRFLGPLFGPLGWLLFFKGIQGLRPMRYFEYWGIHSLNLMVTHYSIIMVLFMIAATQWCGYEFYGWVSLICFLLSMPIQHLLVPTIDRYAKFTLGKK